MKVSRVGWFSVVTVLLLAGLGSHALAGNEKEKEKEKNKEFRMILLEGRAMLGVRVSNVTPEKVEEMKLPGLYGAVVDEVEEDSPAAKAGLQKNDVLLSFDGERVRSVQQLQRLVRETPAQRAVKIEYSRDGQRGAAEVTLESQQARFTMPDIHIPKIEIPRVELPEMVWGERGPRLGVSGDELTPQLAEYFGVKQGKGVLVREVLAGSAAARAGLKAGDVIVSVNGEPTPSVSALRRALREAEEEVTLTFVRSRQEQSVQVKLDKPEPRSPRRVTHHIFSPPAPPAAPMAVPAPAPPGALLPAPPGDELMELQDELMDLYRELGEELPALPAPPAGMDRI